MITIRHLKKEYPSSTPLVDVNVEIKKGEAIGQAIFQKYLMTDDDNAEGERVGGFGSTRK